MKVYTPPSEGLRVAIDGPSTVRMYREKKKIKRRFPWSKRHRWVWKLAVDAPPNVKFEEQEPGRR